MDNRGKRQAASIFGGMGFYIALLVCAVAAGVVGYYALMNNEAETQDSLAQTVDQQEEQDPVAVDAPEEEPAKPVISDEPVVVESLQPEAQPQEEPEEASAPVEDVPVSSEPTLEVVHPVQGETVAVFSVDTLSYDATLGDWRTHDGLDIQAAAGTASWAPRWSSTTTTAMSPPTPASSRRPQCWPGTRWGPARSSAPWATPPSARRAWGPISTSPCPGTACRWTRRDSWSKQQGLSAGRGRALFAALPGGGGLLVRGGIL